MALYDPKIETEAETPEQRAKRFYTFVAAKPPEEEYCAHDGDICAIAQFGMPGYFTTDRLLPEAAVIAAISSETFGELHERLEKLGYGP